MVNFGPRNFDRFAGPLNDILEKKLFKPIYLLGLKYMI